jgi:hypothetical protein
MLKEFVVPDPLIAEPRQITKKYDYTIIPRSIATARYNCRSLKRKLIFYQYFPYLTLVFSELTRI